LIDAILKSKTDVMKTNIRLLIVSVVLMFGFSNLTEAQKSDKKQNKKKAKREKRAEDFLKTQKLIESRNFIFNAERAFPSGIRSIDLVSNPGSIEVKDDSVEADLPFFGRSYTSHYSGNAGMEFKGKVENEKVEINEKKQKIFYTFRIKDKDVYDVTMDISYSGGCSVTINSTGKNSISYGGKIEKIESKEK
jgi:hypothetical protein